MIKIHFTSFNGISVDISYLNDDSKSYISDVMSDLELYNISFDKNVILIKNDGISIKNFLKILSDEYDILITKEK